MQNDTEFVSPSNFPWLLFLLIGFPKKWQQVAACSERDEKEEQSVFVTLG